MLTIAPSILSANFAELLKDCKRVLCGNCNVLHFDVMDGVFVPNISFGLPVLKSLKAALPNVLFDVHLMIIKPHEYIKEFAKAGAYNITIHVESQSPTAQTLADIRAQGCKAGLSLCPKTPVEKVFPFLPLADLLLVMSVEPGFGGQSFLPNTPLRIAAVKEEAKRQNPALQIQVDGGINTQNAGICARAGANILVAGNAIFGAKSPAAAIKKMQEN